MDEEAHEQSRRAEESCRLAGAFTDTTLQKRIEEALKRIEWLLDARPLLPLSYEPVYGDLTRLNTDRTILGAVGAGELQELAVELMNMLGTSCAIYEKNGDYALGIFSSGWCRLLDKASFELCRTADPRRAMAGGEWKCHESCWTKASLESIRTGMPVDVECAGGIRLHAVPIAAGGEIVGSISIGYGDPPRDLPELTRIARSYQVDLGELRRHAHEYESRPPFIVELAKRRLGAAAKLVGLAVERGRGESALEKEKEHYRVLFNAITDALFVHGTRDDGLPGTFVEVNDVACDRLGYTRQELLRMSPLDIDAPDSGVDLRPHVRRVLSGESTVFQQVHVAKSGERIPVEITSRLFTMADCPLILSLVRDDSDRMAAEKVLRESEEKYKFLVETTSTGYLIVDGEGRVVDANQEYVRLTGHERLDQILGRSVLEWTAAHDWERNAAEVKKCVEQGCVRNLVIDYVGPDGRVTPIEVNATVTHAGDAARIMALCRDIAERVRLEAQLRQAQKMEAVGQLAGGVAHDFNNILSAIIGYGHLSAMSLPDDHPVRHHVDQILESAERATTLTQSLLSFSRKQPVKRELVDLNAVLRNLEKFLLRLLREDIDLVTEYCGEELTVLADRGQIEQVVMNLVTNARDAMPGTGTLALRTALSVPCAIQAGAQGGGGPEKCAVISVTDTGVGMDEETKSRIFEPFFTTKEQGRGTGLGLATVYGIVKAHGGWVDVRSEPGAGADFRVSLPLVRASAGATARAAQAPPLMKGGTETILLAEDDDSLRALTARVLGQLGYTVIDAENGLEAVKRFKENQEVIKLVILDAVMPVLNGREAYREISSLARDVRFIFISGYAEDVFTKDGASLHDVAFIPKPATPQTLSRVVREVLDCQEPPVGPPRPD